MRMLNKATCKCIVLPMGYATQMENAFAMISGRCRLDRLEAIC